MNQTLYIVSTTIHVIAAITWVGCLIFMSLVLIPALRELKNPGLMTQLIQGVGRRYKWVGWISLAILTITGYLNLHYRGLTLDMLGSNEFWTSPFGQTLSWKLALFIFIVLLSLVHDTIVGPRNRDFARKPGFEKQAERYRRAASWMGRLVLVISLMIVMLAIMLVRGRP